MLKRIFSSSPHLGTAMGTVFLIIIAGAAYFFAYLPTNKKELEEKQFRCLQNTERNIQEKIDNSLALLKNLVRNYEIQNGTWNHEKIETYINEYPQTDFRLSLVPIADAKKEHATDTVIIIGKNSLYIQICAKNAKFGITYTFKQLLDPLLSHNIFDQYMLFSGNEVVYQTFPSGITQIADTLINNTTKNTSRSPVKDFSLSGTPYKLFSQQFNLKTPIITLTGLLTTENYNGLINKLPEHVVLFLTLMAIAVTLALPWLKLYQMGSKDRMTVSDGLFSLIVPMLLMSIIFFTFLSYNLPLNFGENATEQITKKLAGDIETKFKTEIGSTYKVLKRIAGIYDKMPAAADDKTTSALLDTVSKGLSVNQIFQLNAGGVETRTWPTGPQAVPPGDYASRAYFINLKKGTPLYLDNNPGNPFYIEQVTSWTRASFTTVMSIASGSSDEETYTAISFNIKSLNKLITTAGLTYIIINDSGKVLYHSDESKQLNENLYDEFSEGVILKGAVNTHTSKMFTTNYANQQYDAFVRPIAGLPYSVVAMENRNYKSVREINNFVFSFSMVFCFFFLQVIQSLIVYLVSVKQSSFKKHYIDLLWIGPVQKFNNQYKTATCGNLAIISLLIIWMVIKDVAPFTGFVFILLTASCISILFQNMLYLYFYAAEGKTSEQYKLKRNAVAALAIILLSLNIIAVIASVFGILIMFEIIVGLLLAAIWFFVKWPTVADNRLAFSYSFSFMTFSRIVISNGLPVVLFYISIANYDLKLVTRYRHQQAIKATLENKPPDSARLSQANIYDDSVWIMNHNIVATSPKLPISPGEEHIYNLFRLCTNNFNEIVPGIKAVNNTPVDKQWIYSSLFIPDTGKTFYRLFDGKYIQMQSKLLGYNIPIVKLDPYSYKEALYWLLFISVLIGFWLMLHYVFRRLFALNLPSSKYWQNFDELILLSDKTNSLIFLIGAPGSGKLSSLNEFINNKKLLGTNGVNINLNPLSTTTNGYVADMMLIPNSIDGAVPDNWISLKKSSLDSKYKIVIVNHFEYDIKNPVSNRFKLDFLEELLQKNTAKVIIVSTVHPVNFLDSLNHQKVKNTEETDRSPEHDLERWHVLLGHFKIVIKTLTSYDSSPTCDANDWHSVLSYETRRGHFMHDIYNPIYDEFKHKKIKTGALDGYALSLKLGITSHYFYMYIWQSLTKEEKFLLYDLAEDGLVNPFDDYNLILLICKGIIIREDGQLKLFNQSFRLFILTAIGGSEAMQIQKQIEDNGNWNKLKLPLIILIAAVLAFLFTSQKEAYTSLLKYVTIVTGGVPLVLKLLSGLGSSESKPG